MDFVSLKKNSAAISMGQWVSDIPGLGDARLKVTGLTSPEALTLRSRLERAVPPDQRERDGSLKPEAALRVTCQVLHEVVLQDWSGFTAGGQALPYTSETALQYLTDPDYEAFADAVTWAARVVDRGRAENQEALAKNSVKPSPSK